MSTVYRCLLMVVGSPSSGTEKFAVGADSLVARTTGIDAVKVNGQVLCRHNQDDIDTGGLLPGPPFKN